MRKNSKSIKVLTKDMQLIETHANSKVHPKLSVYFSYCLYKSAMKLRSSINLALLEHDLISPQLGILYLLHEEGAKSQVDLGNCLAIDKATMVKLVDGLEKMKWIKREGSSSDRRIKNICLTPSGEQRFQKIKKVRDQVEKEFLSILNPHDEKELRRIIPKLLFHSSSP